jgi:uncharacterized membrane protein YccC
MTPGIKALRTWLRTHQGKLQFGLRMTLAALASYVLGEVLGLAQTYWAVLSSVIVIQGSVGGSVRAGLYRLIGTVGGAFWGAIVAIAIPHGSPAALALALVAAIAPLAVLTAFRPDYRVAPITAIIVLMGTVIQQSSPLASALERVLEISLGSVVAVAVALFILPARAHGLLARAVSDALTDMTGIVSMFEEAGGKGADREALLKLQVRLSAKIAQIDSRAAEAKVERVNRLADGPDPEPLARTLRRLRNDIAMLSRALATPFPEAAGDRLGPPLRGLLQALAAWLTAIAKGLSSGDKAPNMEDLRAALDSYRGVIAGAGQEPFGSTAGNGGAQRVFALLFLFEQMLQNLQDLADRTNEMAGDQDSVRG